MKNFGTDFQLSFFHPRSGLNIELCTDLVWNLCALSIRVFSKAVIRSSFRPSVPDHWDQLWYIRTLDDQILVPLIVIATTNSKMMLFPDHAKHFTKRMQARTENYSKLPSPNMHKWFKRALIRINDIVLTALALDSLTPFAMGFAIVQAMIEADVVR